MEVKKSVVAAITTALQYYFEMEQQMAAPVEMKQEKAEVPCPAFSAWVMGGRQASMEMRRYWQMRLVR